jgi:hypothetical protein
MDALLNAIPMGTDPMFIRGFLELERLGVFTVAMTFAMDLMCLPYVLRLLKDTPKLYLKGWMMNLLNNLILGPLIFLYPLRLVQLKNCDPAETSQFEWFSYSGSGWCPTNHSYTDEALRCMGVLACQAIGYYLGHKFMHTRQGYWMHRFHHLFNKTVVPSTANAVTFWEYAVAYMLPIFVGKILFAPSMRSLFAAGWIISINNLLIHTPMLHEASEKLPEWCVSTWGHLDHHRVLTKHYAAPTINLDYFIDRWSAPKTAKAWSPPKAAKAA